MGPMILFTHLKIILLQCFQFSVTISSIQMDPIYMCSPHCSGLRQYALLSWPVILHPHPSKHGVGMSLLVFVAKIPAQTLPTICLPLCTGAGFILLEMTKSSREGKISGPSQRRQSRCPGLVLSCFQKTTLLQDGVSRSWQ